QTNPVPRFPGVRCATPVSVLQPLRGKETADPDCRNPPVTGRRPRVGVRHHFVLAAAAAVRNDGERNRREQTPCPTARRDGPRPPMPRGPGLPMTGDVQLDEVLAKLPLPLAQLAGRAHNAKNPMERHYAAFYLWEATLKLLASAAVVVQL